MLAAILLAKADRHRYAAAVLTCSMERSILTRFQTFNHLSNLHYNEAAKTQDFVAALHV